MVHVISTINLKGGVGKTTTTVALAETLSSKFRKRVLVIDLDPQTNATIMLIGETKWRELNEQGHTLARLFRDALEPDNKQFDLDATLQKDVSNVRGSRNLVDLLPSSLELIGIQDRLVTAPAGQFHSVIPTELLRRQVKARLDDYDVVIVDCPPNLGIITLNGLRISEGYIIPTIPDYLSTYGIPQIVTRIREFSKEIAEPIEPLGVVITKYRSQSTVHINVRDELAAETDAPLFSTIIPEANDIASAAEHVDYSRTLKQKYGANKYGFNKGADLYNDLACEILDLFEG